MEENNMKNIVVLKDLPSNLVDEAIVIFKENVNVKNIDKKKENVKVTARRKAKNKRLYYKRSRIGSSKLHFKYRATKTTRDINKKNKKKI